MPISWTSPPPRIARCRSPTRAPPHACPRHQPSDVPEDLSRASEGRWGSREVEITAVDLLGANAEPSHVFVSGDRVAIRLQVRAARPVGDFAFGVAIFDAEGTCCYGTNTHIEGAVPRQLAGDGQVEFLIDRLDLVAGTYKLDVAVHRENGAPYDYHRLLHTFRVTSPLREVGI